LLAAALINPILIAIASVAGIGLTRAAGLAPHSHELVLAAIAALLASEAALIPHFLKIDNSPANLFQSAFLGTIIHLGLFLAQGASIYFMMKPGNAFIWWLMPMYWVTLIGLCLVFIRTMRSPLPSTKTATN